MTRLVTVENLRQERVNRRLRRLEQEYNRGPQGRWSKTPVLRESWERNMSHHLDALSSGRIPDPIPQQGFWKVFDVVNEGGVKYAVVNETKAKQALAESMGFIQETASGVINTGQFLADFRKQRMFYLDAGRDENPLLFEGVFNVVRDPNIEDIITVNVRGNVGVVWERVVDGESLPTIDIKERQHTVKIYDYGVSVIITEKMMRSNRAWEMGPIIREIGKAHNALMNHKHMDEIISASYTGNNVTAAASIGATNQEKIATTIYNAIEDSINDTVNPRRGPFVLLCSMADYGNIVNAIARPNVSQEGFDVQLIDKISPFNVSQIVAYDGWQNTMNNVTTTYSGVSAGTCYLIHTGNRDVDLQSFIRREMQMREDENTDVRRRIALTQAYSTEFGVFTDTVRSVQEVTLPTLS